MIVTEEDGPDYTVITNKNANQSMFEVPNEKGKSVPKSSQVSRFRMSTTEIASRRSSKKKEDPLGRSAQSDAISIHNMN